MMRLPGLPRPIVVNEASCLTLARAVGQLFPHVEVESVSRGVAKLITRLLQQGVQVNGRDVSVEKTDLRQGVITWATGERVFIRVDFSLQGSRLNTRRVSYPQEATDPEVARLLAQRRRGRQRMHRFLK